jgi:hypothetical protein
MKAIGRAELRSGATTDSACPAWRPPASATGQVQADLFSQVKLALIGWWQRHRGTRKPN